VATTHPGFRTALDLHVMGVALMRQNLRRADPAATPDEIEARLAAWLHDRPGAERGDCSPTATRVRTDV
jgi:hypothetical protein